MTAVPPQAVAWKPFGPEWRAYDRAEVRSLMTDEHERRVNEVLAFQKRTGVRIPITMLWGLIPEKSASPRTFDQRLAQIGADLMGQKV